MSFTNKVVLVTGAASGIGAAIALSFAKENAALCIIDIKEELLLKVKEECEALTKNKVLKVVVDLANDKEVKHIVEVALTELKQIDVLVNCAGIYIPGNLESSDIIQSYDKVMSVNVRASIMLAQYALPALKETKGNIINISSVASTTNTTNSFPYNISKAALTKFTKCAAVDLAKKGVRVNCISPGPVKTNIMENGGMTEEKSNEVWDRVVSALPLKTFIKAEEISEMAVYLASDKAATITGADIVIDAGMSL